MRITTLIAAVALSIAPSGLLMADEVSVERGLYIAIIGGCHNCHTEGYSQSYGKIDPSKALKGSSIGLRGPWGTEYPQNMRVTAYIRDESQFVEFMKTNGSWRGAMPWYTVNAMQENDLRSLYRYITSLGEPGMTAPGDTLPTVEPTMPYITIAPPTMPKQ